MAVTVLSSLFLVLLLAERGFSQCFSSTNCTGAQVAAVDQRDCCVGTDDGLSYSNGTTCNLCIVHGFIQAEYSVEENDTLDTVFQLNVKGTTQFAFIVSGVIRAAADGTSSVDDFEQLQPICFTNSAVIRLFIVNDNTTLEYDDRVLLRFTPDNPGLIPGVETAGEYIRDTATIYIIDSDLLEINFEYCDYYIEESSTMLSTPIRLQFRINQNPFNVTLTPVTIDTAESQGVGFFIYSAYSRNATAVDDFSTQPINITIPANSRTYEIPQFFTIVDDNIDEDDQSFAVVAEIGPDVPDNISCFQTYAGERECHGRRGATQIRIGDNDFMTIGFTQRVQTVSECEAPVMELFQAQVNLATLRTSERELPMIIRVQEFSATAFVGPMAAQTDPDYDAYFSNRDAPGDPIEEVLVLAPGTGTIPPLPAAIRNDIIPEHEECFTIRIYQGDVPGRHDDLFICNEYGNDADSYFCQHTICITDDDDPFLVGFVETIYTVDESVGAVNVCVNLTQPQIYIPNETVNVFVIDNSSSVYIPTGAPLATPDVPDFLSHYYMMDGTDYAQRTHFTNFIDDTVIRQEMRIVCYNQPIYDDLHVELDEYAGLTLGVRDNRFTTVLTLVEPMYDQASILILDNDRAVVGLNQSFYQVSEDVGMVEVCAIVTSPSIDCPIQFPFNISLSTTDGTAALNRDYIAADVLLLFVACGTNSCVHVEIVNDTFGERSEKFYFTLIRTPDLDDRIILGPVTTGEVNIMDDDGFCPELSNPVNGTVSLSETLTHSVAIFNCDPGFGLFGTSVLTCQKDGSWSDEPPVCTRCETCPVPEPCDSCCPEHTCPPPFTCPPVTPTLTPTLTSTSVIPTSTPSPTTEPTQPPVPGDIVSVRRAGCGVLEWDPPVGGGQGLTYKIRFYGGQSFATTPSSLRRVLASPTNSLTFTAQDVPSARPLYAIVKARNSNGMHSHSWSTPIVAAGSDCP